MLGDWIIEKYKDKIKEVDESFYSLIERFDIKIVKTESRTYFDWIYYKDNCHEYYYFLRDVEQREQQLMTFFQKSQLAAKNYVYCFPGFDRKIWLIETALFIEKWFEFETLAAPSVPFISEDGELFFEFADAGGWTLFSNFKVKLI